MIPYCSAVADRRRGTAGILVLLLGLAVLASGAFAENPPQDNGALSSFTAEVERLSREALPYLVEVVRTRESEDADQAAPQRIIGNGVSLGGGYFLTSAGVVGPRENVRVKRADGASAVASVVGVDRRTNVAVLQADLSIPAIPMSKDEILFPGDLVVAIGVGGPQGAPTASFGTVVLTEGPSLGYSEADLVQVTAPWGISGGVLVNREGKMVALVSGRMRVEPSPAMVPPGNNIVAGYLFRGRITTTRPNIATLAMPLGLAMDVVDQLTERGFVQRGYLGLQLEFTPPIPREESRRRGVIVHHIVGSGPADNAGLIPGDVILEYAGAPIKSAEDLSYLVSATLPGSSVPVRFLRRGRHFMTKVNIEQAPDLQWTSEMDMLYSTNAHTGLAPTVR